MFSEKVVLYSLMRSQKYFDELIELGLNENYFIGINRNIFLAICEARERYNDDQITAIMLPKNKGFTLSQILEIDDIADKIITITA